MTKFTPEMLEAILLQTSDKGIGEAAMPEDITLFLNNDLVKVPSFVEFVGFIVKSSIKDVIKSLTTGKDERSTGVDSLIYSAAQNVAVCISMGVMLERLRKDSEILESLVEDDYRSKDVPTNDGGLQVGAGNSEHDSGRGDAGLPSNGTDLPSRPQAKAAGTD